MALGNERNRANNTITQIFSNYDLEVAKLFANHPTLKGGSAAEQATAGAFAVASAAVNTVDTANRQVAADGEIKN